MATPSEYERKLRRNIAALQARIDRIFRKAAEEAARIGISIHDLPEGRIFSFDDYPKTLKQVERLLDALHSSVQTTVTDGIRLGWSLADDKNDALVRRVFGTGADSLTPAQQRIFLARNADALEAFIARKAAGLSLSDRVWRYTNAFRSEIEMGLDIGIRSGLPASQMARELKKYLQHPDKLFRRVRDKHGMLRLSKAAAAFHPGQGVYRSSYKNARRLAATETNIAYRTSDHERWQQLDFVVGIEVHLSGNHTCLGRDGKMHELTDICDDLAGKYPKDFKFTGWHPLCRCFATPIMKTDKEMAEENRRFMRGEEPLPSSDSVNTVREYPPAFKEWVEKNAGRIEAAEQRGKLPYFIADNKRMVDRFLGRQPKMTPLEAAAERHAKRTTQQSSAIQQRWNDRRISLLDAAVANGLLPKECKNAIASLRSLNLAGKFDEIGGRIKTLQNAALRHQGRSQDYIDRIQDAWDAKLRRDETTRLVARNVLKAAQNWQEVDFSRLEQLVKDNRLGAMGAETKNVAQAIKAMRDKENALKDLIPDVHALHGKYTLAELADAHTAIQKTFSRWTWDYTSEASLLFLKGKLENEIKYVLASNHKTREIAAKAFKTRLAYVENRLQLVKLSTKYNSLASFKTKSKEFIEWMGKAKDALNNGNVKDATLWLNNAESKKQSLEALKAKKAAKAAAANSNASGITVGNTAAQNAHLGTMHRQDAISKIMTSAGCTRAQAEEFYAAAHAFSYQWDWEIRQLQCGNTTFTSRHGHTLAEVRKKADDLEKFIEASPKWNGGTTYRGMSLSPKEVDDTLKQLKAGNFNNKGAASWSTDMSTANGFSGNGIGKISPFGDNKTERVVIVSKTQKKATSIQHISRFPGEDEVLTSKDCRYSYVKQWKKNGILYIEVKPI